MFNSLIHVNLPAILDSFATISLVEQFRTLNEKPDRYNQGSFFQRERIACIAACCARDFPGDLIEIGCFTGDTTRYLCHLARHYNRRVIAVDPWEAGTQNCIGEEFEAFLKNIEEFKDIVDIIRASSLDPQAIQQIKQRNLCFAFVDGLHTYQACLSDIKTVSHCNGIIAVDDTRWSDDIKKAFFEAGQSLQRAPVFIAGLRESYLAAKPVKALDNTGIVIPALPQASEQEISVAHLDPATAEDCLPDSFNEKHAVPEFYTHVINVVQHIENRLYYRDQSADSLNSLALLAKTHKPTVIVELGTLSGMSTRTWALALPSARMHAVDLAFKAFWKTNEYFPIDTSRITFHEQNILATDFKALWTASDRVLFFVDAHDEPDVPIMQHVLNTALPYLPKDSLVVVDDVWFSKERLGPDNVQDYFNRFLLGQIDELQCFTGHYAPYHNGGSFMGFREVLPLLDFVNSRGIELGYDPQGKQVWFTWGAQKHENFGQPASPLSDHFSETEYGSIEYNPLHIQTDDPLSARVLSQVAHLYRQGRIRDVMGVLTQVFKNTPNPAACHALAICQARLGQLNEAHRLAQLALRGGASDENLQRLARDLKARV